jgi:sugar O-acyltransferase (sialic acid O-acetyltransferase NeuD family)
MLVIGAKGFAKEVLEALHQNNQTDNLVFYDDVNVDAPKFLYGQFKILRNYNEAEVYFKTVDKRFTIGIGNPILRKNLAEKFTKMGGKFSSVISSLAQIGHYGNTIHIGCNIMAGSIITNDISVGKGVLINLNCTIGHDCYIGDFVEMSPGVHISGNCNIGAYSIIGTNATILPDMKIGKNVIVGAGSLVTKDVPDNCMVVGIPAKIIKDLEPLKF